MKTIITISGKTCSGKTHVLNQLLETGSYTKLVTSTTRPPREGEVQGVDYHFIPSSLAEYMINTNKFVESNIHGKQIYGLTVSELETQLASGKLPIVILTPNGILEYRRILGERDIQVISVFIDCPQDLMLQRLAERTAKESKLDADTLKIAFERVITIYRVEKDWDIYLPWDKVVTAGKDDVFTELNDFLKQFHIS